MDNMFPWEKRVNNVIEGAKLTHSVLVRLQAKALGKVLFEQVCRQLNLLEADYFGLEYQEHGSNTKVSTGGLN